MALWGDEGFNTPLSEVTAVEGVSYATVWMWAAKAFNTNENTPAPADVKNGVVYNWNNLTGTLVGGGSMAGESWS